MKRVFIPLLLSWFSLATGTDVLGRNGAEGPAPALPPGDSLPPMTDIYDIKPLVTFGLDPAVVPFMVYGALGILIAALAIGFLAWWSRHRGGGAPVLRDIPPDERALDALRALKRSGLLRERILYFQLTAVFREYLRGRFGIDAPEMTTEELVPLYKNLALEGELEREGREFLYSSDLVKYAGFPPEEEKIARHFAFVESFVHKTTQMKDGAKE